MNQQRRAWVAGTSFPNTPETDRLPQVWHDVQVQLPDGSSETVRVMAEAPGEAIDAVNRMSEDAYARLERIVK